MTEHDCDPTATATAARHGADAPLGQLPLAGTGAGRFGRMFPSLPARDPGACVIDELVAHMRPVADSRPNGNIPAGYTYFGQFIDHDITFDPTSRLQRRNDPHALVNFRTPRFDLDSVYGGGPADQPFLYDWTPECDPGVKLLVDCNSERSGFASLDLPRNRQGRALIGDARNDENAIISQLHLLFIRFHNNVVEYVRDEHPRMSRNAVFEQAQRIVRWHYQWIVIHDFLPKVVGEEMAACVRPRSVALPGPAVIPVEFSGAAYRFGHSMVREGYRLQKGGRIFPILRPAGEKGEHLGGFRRLRASIELDWDLFLFPTPLGEKLDDENLSMRIDPAISSALYRLPPDDASLPSLNMHRGRALGLPAGSDIADLLGIKPLTDGELLPEDLLPDIATLDGRDALLDAPPLWYYILCEAHSRGGLPDRDKGVFLGPVGGRIVAEVLVGLLERDQHSYVHDPNWRPGIGDNGMCSMIDLVRFVEDPHEA